MSTYSLSQTFRSTATGPGVDSSLPVTTSHPVAFDTFVIGSEGRPVFKRLLILVCTPLLLLLGTTMPAQAVSPHFITANATLNANGTLTATFKEAGLGTNQSINYTLSADATATYVCVNKGGANPSAQNKTTVAGPVSASGTFSSGKNGNVVGSLTVSPPPSDITCPPGQTLQLASVSYSNVTLTDTTNNVSVFLGDSFSSGCLLPNVRGAC
jgi:hypothetical protein